MNIKQRIGLCSILLTSTIVHADIGGKVSVGDEGLAGIAVTAYPGGTTTTATDGTWSLATSGKVRVEFTNIPYYLKESTGESSVQFIDGNKSDVNLALYSPSAYTEDGSNSDIAMSFQPNSNLTGNIPVLKVLTPTPDTEINDIPTNTSGDIAINKMGAVWGLAYDATHKTLYASAVVRRYSALGEKGTGAIYKIDRSDPANPVVTPFTTISNTGTIPSNADRHLTNDSTQPSHDTIFNQVGRIGLGDLDISEDGTKLYTINLNTNQLVEIDISSKAQTTYDIGNPIEGCNNNDVKSWAIGQKNGEVYVGSVCTTDTSKGAAISKLNGATFTVIHKIPLDMKGESSIPTGDGTSATKDSLPDNNRWRTWISDYNDLFKKDNNGAMRVSYPAPILSDIVFTEDSGMVLGFSDRTAMQAGIYNYSPDSNDNTIYKYDASGDIYKVCKTATGYINEGENEECQQHDTGAEFKEFFNEEEWAGGTHKEIALGGLAYQQGSHNVITTAFDPVSDGSYDTSGVIWMNTIEGTRTAAQVMAGGENNPSYNGKAGGIGDVEFLNAPAPTEIGNRVWFDENANCVQDGNETGIKGVTLNLYASNNCTGTVEQTTTTDNTGHYTFPVNAGTTYSVCIDDIATQNPLKDTSLTCNSGGTAINNSDATLTGGSARIEVHPLSIGANDHSFDFGFRPSATPATPAIPVTPAPDNNRTVNHSDGNCSCHGYNEDSTPALNGLGTLTLIFLTSLSAFLFRKEIE